MVTPFICLILVLRAWNRVHVWCCTLSAMKDRSMVSIWGILAPRCDDNLLKKVYCCKFQTKNPAGRQTMNSAEATKTLSSFVLMGWLKSYRKDSDPRNPSVQPQISNSNPKRCPFTVTKPVTNQEFSKAIDPH